MKNPQEQKIRARVMDILRNHDQETRVIESQIKAEKKAMKADLKEILLSCAAPSNQFSGNGVRIQSSPDREGRMIKMVEQRDQKKERAAGIIEKLEKQLCQIKEVRDMICQLDARSKCILLALYYPHRTYDKAAEFLQIDRTTVYRQREIALNQLFARAERSETFRH